MSDNWTSIQKEQSDNVQIERDKNGLANIFDFFLILPNMFFQWKGIFSFWIEIICKSKDCKEVTCS